MDLISFETGSRHIVIPKKNIGIGVEYFFIPLTYMGRKTRLRLVNLIPFCLIANLRGRGHNMSLLKRKWEIKGSKWQNLTNKKEISGINRRFCDGKRELGDEESLIVWRISGEVAINENVCRPTYPYPTISFKIWRKWAWWELRRYGTS